MLSLQSCQPGPARQNRESSRPEWSILSLTGEDRVFDRRPHSRSRGMCPLRSNTACPEEEDSRSSVLQFREEIRSLVAGCCEGRRKLGREADHHPALRASDPVAPRMTFLGISIESYTALSRRRADLLTRRASMTKLTVRGLVKALLSAKETRPAI